jgi:hypothetical protein
MPAVIVFLESRFSHRWSPLATLAWYALWNVVEVRDAAIIGRNVNSLAVDDDAFARAHAAAGRGT